MLPRNTNHPSCKFGVFLLDDNTDTIAALLSQGMNIQYFMVREWYELSLASPVISNIALCAITRVNSSQSNASPPESRVFLHRFHT
jgi:hypothetical protein